jgi:anaphase-promoting complex subunit 6
MAVIGESWEPTLFNLGHCYRKTKQYDKAIKYYSLASSIFPNNATAIAALGFSYHLSGNLMAAIEHYHQSLGLQPDDTLTAQLLEAALREQMHEIPI